MPEGWQRLQRRILIRDGWACRLCGRPATEVDHITPGDNHSETNLRAICVACHRAKSSAEGVAARAAKKARGKRPPMRHPGARDDEWRNR